MPQTLGEPDEVVRRPAMHRRGECEMGERITREAVGAALQQDELRALCLEQLERGAPRGIKGRVVGAWRQRCVVLGAHRRATPSLIGSASAGVEVATVLVQVDERDIGVLFEGIEHAIAVVGVDVHIGDALQPVPGPQPLDGDTAIIQGAETCRPLSACVMQAGDRHKGSTSLSAHDRLGGAQRRTDHIGSGLVHAEEGWGVAPIEPTLTAQRSRTQQGKVSRVMEQRELIGGRLACRAETAALRQTTVLELTAECALAVGAEGVSGAEPVTGQALIGDDQDLGHDAVEPSTGDNAGMAQYIYTMNRVGKIVPPKRHILRDISLSFFPGAKIGVLGLNGSGKSTLLKIMAGLDNNIEGEARPQSGIKVGHLPQEPELDAAKTVREEVVLGIGGLFAKLERFNAISERFADPMSDDEMNALLEEQAKLQDALDAAGGWELDRKLEIAADALRLPPWDAKIGLLSGGEKRRVALCRLLLSAPDMLLLDEPTNHLDAESIAWLEKYLEEYPSTVIAVTHDRYFLDNVAEWILELDRGHGIPYHGNYSSWLEQKEKRLGQEERERESLRKTLERELEWVRQNPKARQAKSKARMQRYEELASREFQERNETNEIYIPPGERLGDLVIEAKGLRKAFGDRLLIDDLNFSLPKGGIVGIIGPNGAGKTTLFRMLTGAEKPDAGELRIGPSVKLAYVDQSRQALNDKNSVWQEISNGLDLIKVGNFETPSRSYVGRFNFKGTQQQQLIGELSGGERNRVHLAKVLKSGGNVLLLDEPTNDLDVETLRALEDGLLAYPGCAVVISHDRWFLDRIATHILAFEGNSEVVWFEGNYQEYVEDYRKRRGEDALQPHRIRYKPLTR